MSEFQLVTENLTSTLEPEARVMELISPDWNFIVVFSAIILMVLNKQLFTQRFRLMLAISFQSSDYEKMTREWNPIMSVNGLTVFLSYVALIGLLVQKIVLVFSHNTLLYSSFSFFVEICVFVTAYLIIQYLVVTFYGMIFSIEAATSHHVVAHLSAMAVVNVALMVFDLVLSFYPTKIILIITAAIVLIINSIRIIKTFFEFQILSKLNLFNNFLYFCTLEIIPLSVAMTMVHRLIVTNCVL